MIKARQLQEEQSKLRLQLKYLESIEEIDTATLYKKIELKNHLVGIHAKLQEIQHKYKVADEFLSGFENLDEIFLKTDTLWQVVSRLNKLHQSHVALKDLNQKRERLIQERDRAETYIHSTLEELTQVFKEVKVCPLCHQSLGADAYDHLVHYFKGGD